ncbi:hexosaminidase D [Bombyx mori]|uniref:beta-N-acetylhexosaminidase n=1 Tax=Bombyx mori TaxID=7091 RepID=A0A8R2AIL7_BOMMO|nr:hexosaminidase D [Bombyx mori]
MHRIVHFDLKGAPLKVQYLEQVIIQIKSWGATGVLFEWEDTFPYTGDLQIVGSIANAGGDGLYSIEETRHLLDFANQNGLVPIQLVQTIGHLEFVLKHPAFRNYRETQRSPAVLCPSQPQSLQIVKAMVNQALDLQPDAKYFHIGADEVWHTGVCRECQERAARSEYRLSSLFLEHIQQLVLFIKQKRPELTVLMWDDMLRTIRLDTLLAYKLGELVEPVIWNYSAMEYFQIESDLWSNYKKLFPKVWAGSAFKGANGSCQMLSPVCRYVSNHEAWRREFKKCGPNINFAGVILTGWSRYDHYATLCELLPVSLPSLSSCLKVLAKSDDSQEVGSSDVLPTAQWAGEQLARCVHSLAILRERAFSFVHGEHVTTWMNPWQLERNYTNPAHLETIARDAGVLQSELSSLQANLEVQLPKLTGPRSTEEWLATNVTPALRQVADLHRVAHERLNAAAGISPLRTHNDG